MAAGDTLQGRRVAEFSMIEEPGDYCGPRRGWTGELSAVMFLKPNARDPDAPKHARSIQHVTSPPHVFTEEEDGTLTIKESISDKRRSYPEDWTGPRSDGWHGYLEHGVWRQV